MDAFCGFDDGVEGGGVAAGELVLIETGEPECFEVWAGFLELGDDFFVEADDGDLAWVEVGGFEFFEEGGDDFRIAFDFDEDGFVGGDDGEDFFEGGNFGVGELGVFPFADVVSLEFGEGLGFDGLIVACGFLGGFVVMADDFLVGGEIEIAFDLVGVLFPGEVEGGEGVFGCVVGGPTVGDDEGHVFGSDGGGCGVLFGATGDEEEDGEEDQAEREVLLQHGL